MFKKLSLVVLDSIIALIVLELVLRITETKTYELAACTSLDKNLHHVMIPNKQCRYKTNEWDVTYKLNSLGLRNDEVTVPKPENEFRILVLGDSFTQGHGVEKENIFTNVLEKKLNAENYKKGISIINSGVYAYSPLIEYLYLKEKGINFQPDMVILAFDITDFWDDRQRFNELKSIHPDISEQKLKDKIANAEVEFNFDKINSSDNKNPHQWSKTIYLAKTWLKKNIRIYKTLSDFKKKKNPIVQQDAIFKGDIDRDLMAITRGTDISDENWQKLWDLPVYDIELMNGLLKEKNIPFIVAAIPDATEVSDQESPNRKAFGIPDNYVDPRGPFQNEMAKRLDELSIPFINPLPDFKNSSIFPLYFKRDMHFNENGQNLAGELIFRELKPEVDKLLVD